MSSDQTVVTWKSLGRLAERALIQAYSHHKLDDDRQALFMRIRDLENENQQQWLDSAKNWNRFRHRVWALKPCIPDLEFEFSRFGGLYESYQQGERDYVLAVLEDCQKYASLPPACIEHLNGLVRLANVSIISVTVVLILVMPVYVSGLGSCDFICNQIENENQENQEKESI